MPFNGSGTYSLSDTIANGTPNDADELQAILDDIATGLTNAVCVDGQSSMTGVLKLANGSAAAPAVTFGSDTDNGFYRIGANSVGLSIGGVLLATFDSNGITLASGDVLGTGIIKTAALEDNAVTYAKMVTQGNGTILSNISGGSAVPSANSLSAIVDASFGSTQGQILYRNNTQWTVLATGTSGQFLKTNGAAANPAWATVNEVPSVSGNAGKVLQTDGSTASWSGDSATRCRGYVTVSGTTPTLQSGSVNVASVTRIAGPLYRVTFTSALANATYTAIVTGQSASGYPATAVVVARTTTYFDCQFTVHTVASFLDPLSFDFIVQGGF